jgi:hypothetical protein
VITEEEIKARVEAADKARLIERADAAAKIAAEVGKRALLRAEITAIDVAIAEALSESAALMTLEELSTFTDIAMSELVPKGVETVGQRRRRKPRDKGGVDRGRPRLVEAPTGSADRPGGPDPS